MSTVYTRVRDYELMVVLHPELSEEDLVTEVEFIEGHITAQAGSLRLTNREAPWGRRRLSYPIRHASRDLRDGVYVLIYFTAESTALVEIEREIKLDDKIIRYLLTQQLAPIMEPVVAEEEVSPAGADAPASNGTRPTDAATEATAEAATTPEIAEEPAVVAAESPEVTQEPISETPVSVDMEPTSDVESPAASDDTLAATGDESASS